MPKTTTGAKQREAQGWIVALINNGLGNTDIVDSLRSFGMGYRDSVMFSDINRLRAGIYARGEIGALGPGEAVPDDLMGPIHGPYVRDYRALVQADFRDLKTGEVYTKTVTIHFGHNFSQNDVLNEMDKRAGLWEEESDIALVSVSSIDYRKWEKDAP